MQERQPVVRFVVRRIGANDLAIKLLSLLVIARAMQAPRFAEIPSAHGRDAATAKLSAGVPRCVRSHMVVNADSRLRVKRSVSNSGATSR